MLKRIFIVLATLFVVVACYCQPHVTPTYEMRSTSRMLDRSSSLYYQSTDGTFVSPVGSAYEFGTTTYNPISSVGGTPYNAPDRGTTGGVTVDGVYVSYVVTANIFGGYFYTITWTLPDGSTVTEGKNGVFGWGVENYARSRAEELARNYAMAHPLDDVWLLLVGCLLYAACLFISNGGIQFLKEKLSRRFSVKNP